jgi:hypothetical protein
MVTKHAYRLRRRDEPNNRIKYHKKDEIIYASTEADRRRWRGVDTKLIVKQLDLTEARIARRVNAGQIDIREELQRGREDEDED